jgi:hypothetical protein
MIDACVLLSSLFKMEILYLGISWYKDVGNDGIFFSEAWYSTGR